MNYMKWMSEHVSKKCPVGRIAMLGTHNSGAYSWQNTIIPKCQDKNILEQLFLGVRCFDIRVCVFNGWYEMHHNGHCPPVGDENERQQYEYAMNSIKTFLTSFGPEEIVLIFLSGYDGNKDFPHLPPALTPDQKHYILWKMKDIFGDLL